MTPTLRFVTSDPIDWYQVSIKDLVYPIKSGKSKKNDNGDYVLYGATGIIGNTNDAYGDDSLILAARVGSVGNVSLRCGKFGVSDNVLVIKPKESSDVSFIYHLLANKVNWKLLSNGTSQSVVSAKKLENYKVYVSSLVEQQKIAAFFTALDKKIEIESKKISNLQSVKTCCLKKIFREEMHLIDSDKWNEKQFKDVSVFINGRAYSQEELLNNGKYLVLRVGNFFTNNEYFYSNLELDDDKYANDGDLLYSWSASFGPRIWHGERVIYHYHIWKVVPNGINKKFLFYALQYDVDEIKSQLNGGTMSHLTKKGIEERLIKIPSSTEQIAIGDFLSLLDKRIRLSSKKLEVLRKMKQSFMQQMFV